ELQTKKVYKMTNVSENPETCYFMNPEEQLKVFKEMRKLGLEMIGIYHSHANSPAYPSQRDCELAFYPEADYLIISCSFNIQRSMFNEPEVRAFKITEGKIQEEKIIIRKNILFVCVENSCRSQIAEGIVNNLYWQKFTAYSAGSKPSGIVEPKAIEVMKEIGIDISGQKSKGFEEVKDLIFDYIIIMGCGDECPIFVQHSAFDVQRLDWNIPNPKGKSIEFFRQVRDDIKNKIEELLNII
ncbi:MAG: Mov34/MPN/PAD-1 family protein, partial [Candidatus Omnitrophica bacterium]|nr:Mov34/MPN/PAD-1 family protein [Candidatus Omnitrophota bacterium]